MSIHQKHAKVLSVWVSKEAQEALEAIAEKRAAEERRFVSISELVRYAVDAYIGAATDKAASALAMVNAGLRTKKEARDIHNEQAETD